MPKTEFKEKRSFPRFPIVIPLTYSILNSPKINQTQTQDISVCGIGFITDEELAPNTPLDLCLTMPDNGEQIHVKAEVVWSEKTAFNGYRVGVNLKDSRLKPIPLVLRIVQTKL